MWSKIPKKNMKRAAQIDVRWSKRADRRTKITKMSLENHTGSTQKLCRLYGEYTRPPKEDCNKEENTLKIK